MVLPLRKPSCNSEFFYVDRKPNIPELLGTSRRRLICADSDLITRMPFGGPEFVQLSFFESATDIHISDIQRLCDIRSLRMSDPLSLLVYLRMYPNFADRSPHVTMWECGDDEKYHVCMSLYSLRGTRYTAIRKAPLQVVWSPNTVFAGISTKS